MTNRLCRSILLRERQTSIMTPEAALESQVQRYRQMTGEQRLEVSLRLHQLACDISRQGIRAQCPTASDEEVERKLRERIRLSYGYD